MSAWRLILSPPLDGALNMAIDEVLLNRCKKPTLRFYSWNRPTLSLGHFQKADAGLLELCREKGIDAVRRPTGGRAVLHDREITYSVSASYADFDGPSSLAGIYGTLGRWQVDSLRSFGINASMSGDKSAGGRYAKRDSCFMTSTPYELVIGERKVCGSAQKRSKHAFLQHGSILWDLDRGLFSALFGGGITPCGPASLKGEGCAAGLDEIVGGMIECFASTLGCTLDKGRLSGEEMAEAESLAPRYRLLL